MTTDDAGGGVDPAGWGDELPPDARAAALVAAGLDETVPAGAGDDTIIVPWDGTRVAAIPAGEALARARRYGLVDVPPDGRRVRLAVAPAPNADDLVARLLAAEAVAAVTIVGPSGDRGLGGAWMVGASPDELAAELAPLVDGSDVTVTALGPAPETSVQVLLAGPTPGDVLAELRRRGADAVEADVVVLPRTSGRPWSDEAVEVAAIQDLTGASVIALVGDDLAPSDLAAGLVRLDDARQRSVPFDVALTEAFGRRLLLVGDVDVLIRSGVPLMAAPPPAMAEPPGAAGAEPEPAPAPESEPTPEPDAVGAEPEAAAEPDDEAMPPVEARPMAPPPAPDDAGPPPEGRTTRSGHRRARPPLRDRVRDVVARAAPPPRFLQCTVGTAAGDTGRPDNILRVGANQVDVFVGPPEDGTILGRAMSNAALGFGARTTSVELTVVLVPLDPPAPAQQHVIEIGRTGRSGTAPLTWPIPAGTTRARARLDLVHRNRVLQTGILSGAVGGAPVTLTEVVVLFHDFASLDDRSEFDLALVLNHDDDGRAGVVAHRGTATQQILAVQELEAIAGRLRQQLLAAAFLPPSGAARTEKMRSILVETAVEGASLRNQLGPAVAGLQDVKKIQIVTARASWFLPLELVYDRRAPDEDAELCTRWQAGDVCGDECFPDGDEYRVVCPSAFWGMNRVIERHWVDAVDATAATFLVGASPRRRRQTLSISGAVLAASAKVGPADVKAARAALGDAVVVADGWEAWQQAIADPDVVADLLVVMPHTDLAADTMEISGTTLRGGRFEAARHVTGPRRGQPVVVLFGCDTAGTEDDPAGWATRFMRAHAGVVFATLTMVLNKHAAVLTQQLATELRRDGRTAAPVGELVRDFRVAAVREGLLAALAVTAYGDADWKV